MEGDGELITAAGDITTACRTEEVIREEVVMDKERVEKPITVLKPVTTEVPHFHEHKV